MPKADVTYNTIGFEGNVGSGATFTLYLDNAKTGSKTYHVYFKQLAGSGKLTLTTGKAGATNLVLSVGTYVVIIYVDENGNITTQGATATDVIQTGSTQPVESGAVADEIQNITDIASSLPTDSVLHYSFDEVPDYPDGTAFERYDNNFTTDDWQYNNQRQTLTVNNGILHIQQLATAPNASLYINKSSWTYNDHINYIFSVKIKVHKGSTVNTATIGIGDNSYIQQDITEFDKWQKIVFVVPATRPGYWTANIVRFRVLFSSIDSESYYEISEMYFGDGSYSTPIIDNANGQNNATNNGGIAVQGVSGKGVYFLNGKYAQVSNFNFAKDFTISLWVKPDNADNNLYGNIVYKSNVVYLRNGGSSNNYFFGAIYNLNNSSWQYITTDGFLPINKYTHIVLVKNGTNVKLYFDTSVKRNSTIVDDVNTNNQPLNISYSNNARPQSIDDLLIFNRALSDTEVQALYQNKANTPKYYDLSDYKLKEVKEDAQPQILATPITIGGQSYTTVESALSALAGAI